MYKRQGFGTGTGTRTTTRTAMRWTSIARTRKRTARRDTSTAWKKVVVYRFYVFVLLHLVSFGPAL